MDCGVGCSSEVANDLLGNQPLCPLGRPCSGTIPPCTSSLGERFWMGAGVWLSGFQPAMLTLLLRTLFLGVSVVSACARASA